MLRRRFHTPFLLAFATWMSLSLVLNLAYKTSLLSMLARVTKERPVDTFQDFLDRQLGLYLMRGTAMTFLLGTSPFQAHRRVLSVGVRQRGQFFEGDLPDEVNQLIQEGRAATMMGSDSIRGNS